MKAMRKRPALYMIGAAVLMVVLAGCTVTPLVSNFRYQSSWTLNGQPVACENRDTLINYSFNVYDINQVDRWTETYIGVRSGVKEGPFTHTLGEPGVVVQGNNVSLTNRFEANGEFLPLASNGDLEASAIIVVPVRPTPAPITSPESNVGTTRLELAVTLKNGLTVFSSQNFPLYGNCSAG